MALVYQKGKQPDQLKILMLGKTGHGKSSTANTILDDEEGKHPIPIQLFVTEERCQSGTGIVQKETRFAHGYYTTVVDTPGVCDTEDQDEKTMDEIATAIQKCPGGYDAFVIVLRYQMRLTEEEKKTIKKLEDLFGKEMYDFTILLFTNGDGFKKQQERNRQLNKPVLSFEEYVYQDEHSGSRGAIGPVARKIKGGVVLFDNMETDPNERSAMVKELLRKVVTVKHHNEGKCYNNRVFKIVREERQKAALQRIEALEKKKKEELIRRAQYTYRRDYVSKEVVAEFYMSENDETQTNFEIPRIEEEAQKSILQRIREKIGCTIL